MFPSTWDGDQPECELSGGWAICSPWSTPPLLQAIWPQGMKLTNFTFGQHFMVTSAFFLKDLTVYKTFRGIVKKSQQGRKGHSMEKGSSLQPMALDAEHPRARAETALPLHCAEINSEWIETHNSWKRVETAEGAQVGAKCSALA